MQVDSFTTLLLCNFAINLATSTLIIAILYKNNIQKVKVATVEAVPKILSGPICPECNQIGQHLTTCSLKETSEPKTHVANNLSRGCTICGKKGHYAKKCPNKPTGEKPK